MWLVGLLLVALAATACSQAESEGGGDGSEGSNIAAEPTAGSSDSASETEAPPSDGGDGTLVTDGIDRDATIKFANWLPMTMADAHAPGAGASYPILQVFYDNLLYATSEGFVPQLATEWEFVDDSLVLTLRDDATFHDGSPVDATAVKANLDRARTDEEGSAHVAGLSTIESIDVVDDVTLRINVQPDTGASLLLEFAGPAGMMINPAFLEDAEALKTSAPDGAGSGPYKIVEWVAGENRVVLERYEDHWDPTTGQAARIEADTMDGLQALNSVTTGQYDFSGTNALIADARRLAEAEGLQMGTNDVGGIYAIWLQDRPDPAIAEAMRHAVDREALGALFAEGTAETKKQMYSEGHPLHVPEIDELFTYDPERAQELVASAPEGSTTVTVAGRPTPPDSQVLELLQAQFAAVGIDLVIEQREGGALYEAWNGGQVDGMLSNTVLYSQPTRLISTAMMPTATARTAPESAIPFLTEVIAEADDPALSDEERTSILREVFVRAAEEVWYLPLFSQTPVSIASPDLVNVDYPMEYYWTNLRHIGKRSS